MNLTPKQIEVARDTTRFRVLAFGRGTGKTFLALEEGIACAVAKDKRRVAYFATTIQQARDIAWKRLKERVAPIMLNANEARLEVTIRTQDGGTSEIVLRGWEAIETARGQEFDFIILDEVAFMRDFWNGWEKVLRPTLRISQGGAMFISTPNGFNHFHKLYKMGESGEHRDYKSFHATSYDNPHVSIEEIESAKNSLPADSFAQEYLADFRRVTGLVYQEFDPTRHVLQSLPQRILVAGDAKILNRAIVESRGCLDLGFKNPAAMYTVIKDGEGIYYITDEFYETGKLHEELADLAVSRGIREWYPDPADAEGCAHLRRKGLVVKEVSKDIKAGIQTVQSLFKQNRLFIVNCPNLEFELNQYRWRDQGHSRVDLNDPELPIKEHDHGLDSTRYCLHMWETVGASDSSLDDYYSSLPVSKAGAFRA